MIAILQLKELVKEHFVIQQQHLTFYRKFDELIFLNISNVKDFENSV